MSMSVQNKISKRCLDIQESKSLEVYSKVQSQLAKGERVISLIVGEPSDPPARIILDATIRALENKKTGYSLVAGELILREHLIKSLSKEGISPIDLQSIIISNGSKHSLFNIFQAICNPGDEIIIPTPYWVTFPESVKLAGGVPIFVETDHTHTPTIEMIEAAITKKTKAIIINCPNNPCGVIYSNALREKMLQLCLKHNIFLISDEAYDKIVFDDQKFTATAKLADDWRETVITVRTFSKTYAMTGFRVGITFAHPNIITAINRFQGHLCGNVCTFAQYGAVAALDLTSREIDLYVKIYEQRRNLAYRLFNVISSVQKPEGAFYLFMDIRHWLGKHFQNSNDFCMAFLHTEKVAFLPGSAFGKEGYIRISYATSDLDIEEGAKRLAKFIARYSWK